MTDKYPGSDVIVKRFDNPMTLMLKPDAPIGDILNVLWQLDIVPMVSKTCADQIILTFKGPEVDE